MAIYDISYIGTPTNRVYFNDYQESFGSVGAIFRIKTRAPQRRNLRELDIPIPFENGISDFKTLIGETAYILEGTMYPTGESGADSGLAKLRKVASLDVSQNDVLSDSGYVPYVWNEFAREKQVFMKVLYVQAIESARQGLVQDFRLICKIKDPTIYEATLKQASTEPAAFSVASGTAIHPFSFPIIYGASTSSVSVDAINLGDMAAYPISINIHGPVNTPKITNASTGQFIEVDTNLAGTGNELVIAYDKDSLVVERDGVSVIDKVSAASDYWKLQPGSNVISLTGSSISDDAFATVSYRSAWPLS